MRARIALALEQRRTFRLAWRAFAGEYMKRMLVAAALVAASVMPATPAWAEAADDCSKAPNQMEMGACLADNHAAADAALNTAYKTLMGKLNAHDAQLLSAAEMRRRSARPLLASFLCKPASTLHSLGTPLHAARPL